MKQILSTLALVAVASTSQAAIVSYDFAGYTNVGGITRSFTGIFEYDNAAPSHTVYFPGTGPLQQGFRSSYAGGLRSLSITLNNGESVHGGVGSIDNNNIHEAPPGSQVPAGKSLQAWSSGVSGTINGLQITNIYLAFLPVPANFNWGPLDDYFHGPAETMLQLNPAILPTSIDPALTGTRNPANLLEVFNGGLFLGTNHALTNTVNTITSFSLHVPAPSTALAMVLSLAGLNRRRR